jgi:hypothetical protein
MRYITLCEDCEEAFTFGENLREYDEPRSACATLPPKRHCKSCVVAGWDNKDAELAAEAS